MTEHHDHDHDLPAIALVEPEEEALQDASRPPVPEDAPEPPRASVRDEVTQLTGGLPPRLDDGGVDRLLEALRTVSAPRVERQDAPGRELELAHSR